MGNVPPVVAYRVTGGPAYLVAWERHPDRSWWARVIWIEIARDGYTGKHARVRAEDVAPVPGQDYRAVPRVRVDPRRTPPSDPTDPRDPVNRAPRGKARYRRAFEAATRRPPEPDF